MSHKQSSSDDESDGSNFNKAHFIGANSFSKAFKIKAKHHLSEGYFTVESKEKKLANTSLCCKLTN
jgi:hypothetical protein